MKERYQYDNTARKIDVRKAINEAPTGEPLKVLKTNQKIRNKMGMSAFYVAFLLVATVVCAVAFVSQIKLMSLVSESVDRIADQEALIYNLTLANDDEYSKMVKSVDLDEIRRTAVEDLGMVYASGEQIITYTRENSDYVRQVNEISN